MTRDLAVRHVGYGVRREDYDSVGTAVLRTLAELLDDNFTAEHEEA